jgi:hypothetical protein
MPYNLGEGCQVSCLRLDLSGLEFCCWALRPARSIARRAERRVQVCPRVINQRKKSEYGCISLKVFLAPANLQNEARSISIADQTTPPIMPRMF